MESRDPNGDAQPSRAGYVLAIAVSAIGHAALAALVFLVLPGYLASQSARPVTYSVKIEGELPAGDFGSHLPKLSSEKPPPEEAKPPPSNAAEESKLASKFPPLAAPDDKNAIALNTIPSPAATPEPTPTPQPLPSPELAPTPQPTPPQARVTPATIVRLRRLEPRVTRNPPERRKPAAKPSTAIAKLESTPSVEERLNKVREQLLKEHLAQSNEEAGDEEGSENESESEESGGGPVAANEASEGSGTGVGPGEVGGGVQQDPEFLLYYRTVQDKVKKAWSFSGGTSELQTTVNFAIAPDGGLAAVKISQSSHDSAYDDSVVRAIRRAAPFPAPPEKYRSMFGDGVEAVFKLGELSS